MYGKFVIFTSLLISFSSALINNDDELKTYRISPKLIGPSLLARSAGSAAVAVDDVLLTKLDASLKEISTVYMQALFAGTHTAELETRMRRLEIELFDLLDELYRADRLKDYMQYEAEVTRQMILYNMLKKLFGYAEEAATK